MRIRLRAMPESAATPSDQRRAIARRVADANRALAGDALLAIVSGSVVEGLADARSDVDMAIVLAVLPAEAALRSACGAPWIWQLGSLAESSLVVAFQVDGIEVQIAYSDEATLARELQPRIAVFPAPLGEAMAAHFLGRVTPPWRRELQVQIGHRLVGALAGLNGLYFTTFQFKRMGRFVARMAVAPEGFAARLEQALAGDVAKGFAELHALEAEVTALVAQRWPALEGLPRVRTPRRVRQAWPQLTDPRCGGHVRVRSPGASPPRIRVQAQARPRGSR